MAKSESAETLLKRLQKIERAQGRLGDITTRIRVQAETLAELLKGAEAFVNEKPAPAKRSASKRTVARATAKSSTTPRTTRPAKAATATRRRAPRKVVSG
jgi:topoisomerase IA-like protein